MFSRGAKFSLFKPAEEMVYIGLDDESRTKGKAAIDVVGAQSGKSIGSMLQQALLILRCGAVRTARGARLAWSAAWRSVHGSLASGARCGAATARESNWQAVRRQLSSAKGSPHWPGRLLPPSACT